MAGRAVKGEENQLGHRANVRPGVDRVGDHQCRHDRIEQHLRIVLTQHPRETHPGDHANFRAHELHCGHHGEREQRGPERRVSE
jgi:hypothetical protein